MHYTGGSGGHGYRTCQTHRREHSCAQVQNLYVLQHGKAVVEFNGEAITSVTDKDSIGEMEALGIVGVASRRARRVLVAGCYPCQPMSQVSSAPRPTELGVFL